MTRSHARVHSLQCTTFNLRKMTISHLMNKHVNSVFVWADLLTQVKECRDHSILVTMRCCLWWMWCFDTFIFSQTRVCSYFQQRSNLGKCMSNNMITRHCPHRKQHDFHEDKGDGTLSCVLITKKEHSMFMNHVITNDSGEQTHLDRKVLQTDYQLALNSRILSFCKTHVFKGEVTSEVVEI